MFTLKWQHIILAASGYAGTSRRIAKMRAPGVEFAPPYRADNPLFVTLTSSPNSREWAPPTYAPPFSPAHPQFGASTYEFVFWSVNVVRSDEIVLRSVHPGNPPLQDNTSFADGTIVNAKAWYLRRGETPDPGREPAVEIDAFDTTINDFISDDFVNVSPDSPAGMNRRGLGDLEYSANEDGFIRTAELPEPITITAHEIETVQYRYQFAFWLVIHSTGGPVPLVRESTLTIDPGCGIKAYAIYHRFDRKGVPPIAIEPVEVVDTLRPYALYHNGIPVLQISPTGEVGPIPMGDPGLDLIGLTKMLRQAAKSLQEPLNAKPDET